MKKKDPSRRQALKSFLGLSVLPFINIKGLFSSPAEDCLTTVDIEGPFFSENAPNISNIAPEIDGVPRLFITGTIYANDCITPIPNALIEVWQANDEGAYENIDYRGTLYSDNNGNYAFESIQPGKYLNGSQSRPSHIHYKVTYLNNPNLTTQLYFEGDTSIDIDPWASTPEASDRIIPLSSDDNNNLNGVFDVYLDMDGPVGLHNYERNDQKGSIISIFPIPIQNEVEITFYNRKNSNIKLDVCDVSGRVINTLTEAQFSKGMNHLKLNDLNIASGVYVVRLWENNQSIDAKRILVR